jgi:hypothetical protein
MMDETQVNTAVILHDVHDAEWICTHQDEYKNVHLVATHASVIDYLEPRQVDCEYLSSYLTNHELQEMYVDSAAVNSILAELDGILSPAINEMIDMDPPLDYFYDCYRYLGRYEYLNHRKLELALDRLIFACNADKVILFKSHFPISASSFFTTALDVYQILLERKKLTVEILTSPVSESLTSREKIRHRLTKLRKVRWFVRSRLVPGIWNRTMKLKAAGTHSAAPGFIRREAPSPALMVSLDGENSNGLIPENLRIHGLAAVSLNGAGGKVSHAEPDFDWSVLIAGAEQMLLESKKMLGRGEFDGRTLLKAIVLDDFVSNCRNYLLPLVGFRSMEKVMPVRGAIWTSPPISPGAKPLVVDYLLKQKKWVVGRQHGGNYGIEKSHPRHFDSDYSWCSHFLSFGFTRNDLMETDPPRSPHCEIIPVGTQRRAVAHTKAKNGHIDVFFPISNATYFHRDSVRPLQHDLAQIQRDLLRFLDQWQNKRVVIKPFFMYDYPTSSFSELLRSLKHVEVVDYLDLAACFDEFDIESVVIEYVSSPLFECLPFDVEVLAMRNPLIPLSAQADESLRRRVHFFDDLQGLETGISDMFLGKLPQLRDAEFGNRYLRPYDRNAVSAFWQEMLCAKQAH